MLNVVVAVHHLLLDPFTLSLEDWNNFSSSNSIFFLYVCRLLCVAAKLHFCKDIKLWPLTDLWIWSRFYSLLATTVAV